MQNKNIFNLVPVKKNILLNPYKPMAERIKYARISANLSLDELASTIGVSSSFLADVEEGKYRLTSQFLYAIAQNTRQSLMFLVMGFDNERIRIANEKLDKVLTITNSISKLSPEKCTPILDADEHT